MSYLQRHSWRIEVWMLPVMAMVDLSSAMPMPSIVFPRQNSRDDDGPNGVAPQVWIPAVVVVLFLLGIFALMWSRTTMLSRLRPSRFRNPSTAAATNTAAAREVSATQLAGVTTTVRPARAGRRNRRTPSQMSVTSLPVYMKEPGDHELVIFRGPEGMEDDVLATRDGDPAERDSDTSSTLSGRETPLPRPATPNIHERDASAPGLHPSTPNLSLMASRDTSALSIDPAAESSTARLIDTPSPTPTPARNRDSAGSSNSRTGLMASGGSSDEREGDRGGDGGNGGRHDDEGGARADLDVRAAAEEETLDRRVSMRSIPAEDAPPYFEVVPIGHLGRGRAEEAQGSGSVEDASTSTSPPPGLVPTPAPVAGPSTVTLPASNAVVAAVAETSSRRRSGILNLLHLNVLRQSPPPAPPVPSSSSHAHTPSDASSLPPALNPTRHRASRSNASTPSLFRTISAQRSTISLTSTHRPQHRASNSLSASVSQANLALTSPSALSVNSISSPLPHTLVRTEIRYPRGGPTPEQIKLISSRESLGRFGVPYGAQAIAHAAATSRLALDIDHELPPPVFESPTTEGAPRASTSSNVDSDVGDHYHDRDHDRDGTGSDRDDIVRGVVGSVRASGVTERSVLASEGPDDARTNANAVAREHLRDGTAAAPGASLHVAVSSSETPAPAPRSASPASSTLSYATAAEVPDSPLFYPSENVTAGAGVRSS